MQNKTNGEPNKSMLAVSRLGEGVPPPPAAQDGGVVSPLTKLPPYYPKP
jgi:hypothetical protein